MGWFHLVNVAQKPPSLELRIDQEDEKSLATITPMLDQIIAYVEEVGGTWRPSGSPRKRPGAAI